MKDRRSVGVPRQHTGATATWEEASKCYYCDREMQTTAKRRPQFNLTATVHVLICMYEDCPYFVRTARANDGDGDRWTKIVERLADGTIPIRPEGRRGREFQKLPRMSQEAYTALLERIEEEDRKLRVDRQRGKFGGLLDSETGRVIPATEE